MPKMQLTDFVMKRFRFIWTLALLMLSTLSYAQDEVQVTEPMDIDAFVTQVNDQCPISFLDGWSVQSCVSTGDSVILVIQTPANIAMILPMLSGNEKSVKRLWMKQLSSYGEQWSKLMQMLEASNKALALTLRPEGSETEAVITFDPSDFKND
jgi:hypothetical protein